MWGYSLAHFRVGQEIVAEETYRTEVVLLCKNQNPTRYYYSHFSPLSRASSLAI